MLSGCTRGVRLFGGRASESREVGNARVRLKQTERGVVGLGYGDFFLALGRSSRSRAVRRRLCFRNIPAHRMALRVKRAGPALPSAARAPGPPPRR